MNKFIFVVVALVLSLGARADEITAVEGLIAQPSSYSASETVNRLEAALKASSMTVFGRLDHSQAAEGVGLTLKPLVVVVFGNPKNGTPLFVRSPTLGIDLPQKFLVWEDAKGQVWLAYNSAEYLHQVIRPRHGVKGNPAQMKTQAALLEKIAHSVVQ
ncbi:MAG TPA: DUF302 domain-containing protein [Burkholderiales bacterium]